MGTKKLNPENKRRADIQREYRRRKALGAAVYRIELPSDVVRALERKGVDVDDPQKLGEAVDDLVNG